MAGYWPIRTTIEFSRHSDRYSNIKMRCSIGLLKLKFIINEQRSIEFQFKSRSSSTSYVSKTLDWHLWPFSFRSSIAETVQPVHQIFHLLRLTIFSAFSLCCSWTEKSTMENEDNTSSYITACVLNAFLSYTAVMLNDLRLNKTLIITKTFKNAAFKPGCFWSGCWFDGAAFAHCLFRHDNGAKNWKQSSL